MCLDPQTLRARMSPKLVHGVSSEGLSSTEPTVTICTICGNLTRLAYRTTVLYETT
jgi:hypothetical protein